MFDLAATVLMNIGLLHVTASVYQMMRGAEMLFAALFSVVFLKRHLNLFHYMGILCCVVWLLDCPTASKQPQSHCMSQHPVWLSFLGEFSEQWCTCIWRRPSSEYCLSHHSGSRHDLQIGIALVGMSSLLSREGGTQDVSANQMILGMSLIVASQVTVPAPCSGLSMLYVSLPLSLFASASVGAKAVHDLAAGCPGGADHI